MIRMQLKTSIAAREPMGMQFFGACLVRTYCWSGVTTRVRFMGAFSVLYETSQLKDHLWALQRVACLTAEWEIVYSSSNSRDRFDATKETVSPIHAQSPGLFRSNETCQLGVHGLAHL